MSRLEIKQITYSTIESIKPASLRPDETYAVVTLKTGHEIHGVKLSDFKVGDEVVAQPYIQGTILLKKVI